MQREAREELFERDRRNEAVPGWRTCSLAWRTSDQVECRGVVTVNSAVPATRREPKADDFGALSFPGWKLKNLTQAVLQNSDSKGTRL
jgi:hypothetical protein